MTNWEKVIFKLQILRTWCAANPDHGKGLCVEDCRTAVGWLDDALALLKAQNLTIEPKLLELEDETKAWLDEMDAVDALGNIANICMDFDGYRTANGLGELINEVRTYAKYCADRLEAREQQQDYETSVEMTEYCERYEPTYNSEDGSM